METMEIIGVMVSGVIIFLAVAIAIYKRKNNLRADLSKRDKEDNN